MVLDAGAKEKDDEKILNQLNFYYLLINTCFLFASLRPNPKGEA